MKPFLAWLALAISIFGQTATITWSDGSAETFPLEPGGGESLTIMRRHPGRPDNWGASWTPQPAFATRIVATAPGKTLLGGEAIWGAKPLGGDTWEVAAPGQFKYWARRSGGAVIKGYEPASQYHCFDGGSHVGYMRFVPKDDQWEERFLATIPPAAVAKCLDILNYDDALIAQYPWFDKLLGWYTYDASSRVKTTPAGKRNFGWLLVPENFMYRWAGQPGGLPGVRHFMGFGTRAAGNACCNEHYGHPGHWLYEGIRHQKPASIGTALYLLRYYVAYGLIDCDASTMKGLVRNETGTIMRGTGGMAWNGSGGTRNLARALESMLDFYEVTGDPKFKQLAEMNIGWAFQLAAGKPYFPNQITKSTNEMCHEEGTHWAIADWIENDPATFGQFEAPLKLIVEHMLTHCVASSGRVGYKWNPTPNPGAVNNEVVKRKLAPLEVTFGGQHQGAFVLGLRPHCEKWWPGRFSSLFDKIESHMATVYANRTDCDACFGQEGPGAEKVWAYTATGLRRSKPAPAPVP